MKTLVHLLALARDILNLLAAAWLFLSLTSCKNLGNGKFDPDPQELATLGNIALTAGTIGGVITPAEAKAIRQGGKLILDSTDTQRPTVATLSDAVVDYAEENGHLSPADADALRQAGTIDLTPQSGTGLQPVSPQTPATP